MHKSMIPSIFIDPALVGAKITMSSAYATQPLKMWTKLTTYNQLFISLAFSSSRYNPYKPGDRILGYPND